jgi:hypothetical protein
MTSTAFCLPASVSSRERVCDTVGPECPRRSEMRARRGTMPSSSSSRMVRRYISVVSIRSVMAGLVARYMGSGSSLSVL